MLRPLLIVALLSRLVPVQAQVTYAFVGSYTEGMPGEGIHVFRLDSAGGHLEPVWQGTGLVNASFLTMAPNGRTLYACTESKKPGDGRVRAFAVDSLTGTLRALNVRPSGGDNPVYVSVHPDGRWLVVANYTGSSITAYPLLPDGSIGEAAQHIAFTDAGSGAVADRQEGSHVHAAVFAPDGRHLYVPDLGCDRIRAFAFDVQAQEPLRAVDDQTIRTAPGSGPRHLTFHPDGRTAYCLEELSGTLCVYRMTKGRLEPVQRTPSYATAPAVGSSADVRVSPDGRFVYTSNRAPEHSIGIFAIDPSTGQVSLVGHADTKGHVPRGFAPSPDGAHLLVANSATRNIVLFSRDAMDGTLRFITTVDELEGAASVVWRTYAAPIR